MERLTDEEIKELERLEKAATPGPWEVCLGSGETMCTGLLSYHDEPMGRVLCDFLTDYMLKKNPPDHRPDMMFVEMFRNKAASILAELRERRAADIECSRGDCGRKATTVDWLGRDVCDEHK